jgi:type II secretory pathway component PulM
MTIGDWTFEAARWLNTAVYLVGLGIAVWAFLRCRKRGYLVVALFFALVLFSWYVWPPISHAIYTHRTPVRTQQKIDADFQEAVNQVLAQKGHPVPTQRINIQVAPIVLVFGLWLLVRREPECHQPHE